MSRRLPTPPPALGLRPSLPVRGPDRPARRGADAGIKFRNVTPIQTSLKSRPIDTRCTTQRHPVDAPLHSRSRLRDRRRFSIIFDPSLGIRQPGKTEPSGGTYCRAWSSDPLPESVLLGAQALDRPESNEPIGRKPFLEKRFGAVSGDRDFRGRIRTVFGSCGLRARVTPPGSARRREAVRKNRAIGHKAFSNQGLGRQSEARIPTAPPSGASDSVSAFAFFKHEPNRPNSFFRSNFRQVFRGRRSSRPKNGCLGEPNARGTARERS